MPLAVTHVLTSIISVDLYRDYFTRHKRYFTLHTILFAGIFGLLPDIDILISLISQSVGVTLPWLIEHGGITHTPFFALLFLIPGFMLWNREKHTVAMYFFVAFFAIMLHIVLDFLLGGGRQEGIMWLFPFSFQATKIHLINYYGFTVLPQAIDAIILLAWLWHEEVRHKISDFI